MCHNYEHMNPDNYIYILLNKYFYDILTLNIFKFETSFQLYFIS